MRWRPWREAHADGSGSDYTALRETMVREQLEPRGITDPRVLEAMRRVPRHLFVPEELRERSYDDRPLPIGGGQTISQPYIVALMTQAAVGPEARNVLDAGTGSGYQAAVLAELVEHVWSIEFVPELARTARERLRTLGYDNVTVAEGDAHEGWAEHAPYDAIVVACAPTEVPPALIDQLAPGAILVIPVGSYQEGQSLERIEKLDDGSVSRSNLGGVAFVPMVGESEA